MINSRLRIDVIYFVTKAEKNKFFILFLRKYLLMLRKNESFN